MEHEELMLPMRDGARLQSELFLPQGPDAKGPLPALLARCMYGTESQHGAARRWAKHGYAVVLQNVRGRHKSEGGLQGIADTPEDGYDTLEWMARQAWCNGRIGTFGGSALARVQTATAFLAHPAHRAMCPQVLPFGMMSHLGGAFMFSQIPQWLYFAQSGPELRPYESVDWMPQLSKLPVVDVLNELGGPLELYRRIVTRPHEAYFSLDEPEKFKKLHTPNLMVTGWYDHCATGPLDFFILTQRHAPDFVKRNTHLVIGPWDHSCDPAAIEEYGFGPAARREHFDFELAFFHRHLRENRFLPKPPPVRIFVMGRNVWRDEESWPLARAVPTKFYLRGGGAGAASRWGELLTTPPGEDPPERFTYDPADPVPTVGGANSAPARVLPMKRGPRDQSATLDRGDVLLFASEALKTPLEVTGPLKLVLYAASSAKDTDFTGKLMVLRPGGDCMLLQDGVVRARFRHGLDAPALLKRGQVERYEIDLWFTSYEFQAGERIGLAVSSSNFPRFNRNLNTGGDNERDERFVRAEQTIFHDAARPSHLLLPVVPRN